MKKFILSLLFPVFVIADTGNIVSWDNLNVLTNYANPRSASAHVAVKTERELFLAGPSVVPDNGNELASNHTPGWSWFRQTDTANIIHYGAIPNDGLDDRDAIQAAVDSLPDGGTVYVPDGDFDFICPLTATVTDPYRVYILKTHDLHFVGAENAKFIMSGITTAEILLQDDPSSSGRDIFTCLSFVESDRCSVTGIDCEGNYDMIGTLRYESPRAKFIGVIGCRDFTATDCSARRILGNAVNATPSSAAYEPGAAGNRRCENIFVSNFYVRETWENGINYMGGVDNSTVVNSRIMYPMSNGIELSGTGCSARGITIISPRNGGIGAGSDSVIQSCYVEGSYQFGLYTSAKVQVSDFRVKGSGGPAWYGFGGVSGSEIIDLSAINCMSGNNNLIFTEAVRLSGALTNINVHGLHIRKRLAPLTGTVGYFEDSLETTAMTLVISSGVFPDDDYAGLCIQFDGMAVGQEWAHIKNWAKQPINPNFCSVQLSRGFTTDIPLGTTWRVGPKDLYGVNIPTGLKGSLWTDVTTEGYTGGSDFAFIMGSTGSSGSEFHVWARDGRCSFATDCLAIGRLDTRWNSLRESSTDSAWFDRPPAKTTFARDSVSASLIRDGMMFYNSSTGRLELRSGGVWTKVLTDADNGFVDVRDYGAIGDGVTDDSSAVQAAIDDSDGVFIPQGTFMCRNLTLDSNTSLIGVGHNSVLQAYPIGGGTSGFILAASVATQQTNLYIGNLHLKGSVAADGFTPATQYDHNLALNNVKDVRIENVRFSGMKGDGIYLGTVSTAVGNTNVVVTGCLFDNEGLAQRNPISVIDVQGMRITDNAFIRCTTQTTNEMPGSIDFEPNISADIVRDVTIANNEFRECGGAAGIISFGLSTQPSYDEPQGNFVVSGNRFKDCIGKAFAISVSQTNNANVLFSGNTVNGMRNSASDKGRPFLLSRVNGITIADNKFHDTDGAGRVGISTTATNAVRNVQITGNSFVSVGVNEGYAALAVYKVDGLVVSRNDFENCGGGTVIAARALSPNDAHVHAARIEDNVVRGVWATNLTRTIVSGTNTLITVPEFNRVIGNMSVDGAVLQNDWQFLVDPSIKTVLITAAANSISPYYGETITLDPNGDYTLTSTPTIPNGVKGQTLKLMAGNSEVNTVTLQDQDTLGGSNLQLMTSARTIGSKSLLVLQFDGDDWIEQSFKFDGGYYEDMRIPALQLAKNVSPPGQGQFLDAGGLETLLFDDASDEQGWFTVQLPHAYIEGTDISPHVHWTPVSTNVGTVTWGLEYSWQNVNGTFAASSTIIATNAASGTAWYHQIAGFPDISGIGRKVSSVLMCRFFRDADASETGAVDDHVGDAALVSVDFHIRSDGIGSEAEFTKN